MGMIQDEVRKSWLFRFDWFMKTRKPEDLAKRCNALIRIVENEFESEEEDNEQGQKRKAEGGVGSSAKKSKERSEDNSDDPQEYGAAESEKSEEDNEGAESTKENDSLRPELLAVELRHNSTEYFVPGLFALAFLSLA